VVSLKNIAVWHLIECSKQWKGGLKEGTCAEGTTLLLPISEPLEQVVQHYIGACVVVLPIQDH